MPPAAAETARHTTPSTQPFNRAAARSARDALAPPLTDCRIAKGHSGKVEVTFAPDGHVAASQPLGAYAGTFGGKCVANHLKKAHVPPFAGAAVPYAYTFVVPR